MNIETKNNLKPMILYQEEINAVADIEKYQISQINKKADEYVTDIFNDDLLTDLFDTFEYADSIKSNKVLKCIYNYEKTINSVYYNMLYGFDKCIELTMPFNTDKNKVVSFSARIYKNNHLKFFCNNGWAPDYNELKHILTSSCVKYDSIHNRYNINALIDKASGCNYTVISITEDDLYYICKAIKSSLHKYCIYVLEELQKRLKEQLKN